MHKFLCTRNTICVHVTCTVVILHAISEGLGSSFGGGLGRGRGYFCWGGQYTIACHEFSEMSIWFDVNSEKDSIIRQ